MSSENSRVFIDGVPDMPVGDRWDMQLRGIQVLLEHRGEKTTLDDLMVYSGDAFNLCFASNWQDSAYLCIPTDTLANVAKAYGYDYEWLISPWIGEMRKMDAESRQKLTEGTLERIWSEIDLGRPVMLGGAADRGCGPWSVAVGYDRENLMMCHVGIGDYRRWSEVRGMNMRFSPVEGRSFFWNGRVRGTVRPSFVGGWQNNPAFILKDKASNPSEKEKVIDVLRLAVDMFNAGPHRVIYWGGITYSFGRSAYEQWADAISVLDYPADKFKTRPREAYAWYDMTTVDVMVDNIYRGRTAAANFLKHAVDVLPEAKDPLNAAAKHYLLEVDIVEQTFSTFMPMLTAKEADRAAMLSNSVRKADALSSIEKMLKKEAAAIQEIGKALELQEPQSAAA